MNRMITKVILTLVGFIAFMPNGLSQNKRVCDIAVGLIYPANNYTFKSPGWDSCVLSLRNLGPDTVYAVDMYGATVKFGGYKYLPSIKQYGKNLAKGDSLIVKFPLKLIGTNDADNVQFCVYSVTSYTPSAAGNIVPLMLEEDTPVFLKNNTPPCAIGFHRMVSSAIDEKNQNEISIFPNPAMSELRFVGLPKEKNMKYLIYDVNGKEVIHDNSINSESTIDISKLGGGLYFVQLKIDSEVLVVKFLKK